MKRNFTKDYLSIHISRVGDNEINMGISSDYSRSERKSQLYVNGDSLAVDVERLWKSIKTKKLVVLSVSFDEQDYYDNEVDVYYTPVVSIRRGLKKARISTQSHGCIPKEWGFDLTCRFKDTTTVTPLLEVIKTTLGSFFTASDEKNFRKAVKPFLQKKKSYMNFSLEDEDY